MKLADYLKWDWKKPELDGEGSIRVEKKKALKDGLESAYSRLESVEILSSNSKPQDVFLLAGALLVDLYNLVARFFGQDTIANSSGIRARIEALPEEELRNLFLAHDRLLNVSEIGEPSEEEVEVVEEQITQLLSSVEKFFLKTKKQELHTALDDFQKKRTIQISVVGALLLVVLASYGYIQYKFPPFKTGALQVYYLTPEAPNPSESNAVTKDLEMDKKGEWVEYTMDIPGGPKELIGVRIDPVNQRRVRIGMSHIRYLGADGGVLYERDFQLDENLIPKDIKQIGASNDIKSGRAVPGGYSEIVSIGSDPFVIFNLPQTKNVAKVAVRLRVIEESKKFKD